MQKIILLLLALCGSRRAQAQASPCTGIDEVLLCTTLFQYDAAGNRVLRQEVCHCGIPDHRSAGTGGTGARKAPASVAKSPALGAGEAAVATIARLYPNPASTSIRVVFSASIAAATLLTLTNAQGIVIATIPLAAGSTEADIPLRDYPAGMYIARLHEGIAQRFVKVD